MAEAAVIEKLQKRGMVSERAGDRSLRKYEPMRRILLIRHGATPLNNADVSVDRIRGHIDVELSDGGRQEATRLAHRLRNGTMPDGIVSSDLARAADTAKIISKITKVPVLEVTKGFRPWDVGKFSGEITKTAIPELRKYACDMPDKPVPGGEQARGEAFDAFKSRFFNALHEALEKHNGVLAIVTHHRGERLLEAWRAADFPVNGDIHLPEFTKRGEPTGHVEPFEISVNRLRRAATAMRG